MDETNCLVALTSFVPFGPVRTKLFLEYFGSAKDAWNASFSDLSEIGLKKDLAEKFIYYRKAFNFEKYQKLMDKYSVKFVTKFEDNYPKNLSGIDSAPFVLYYVGELSDNDESAVAIVGSRKMTTYGREVTRTFASEMANYGITIVSGLALGIDAMAHRSALDAGGRCVAVIASGLDAIGPAANRSLAERIVRENCGVIFSEYPIGFRPTKSTFPNRNRIISGLAKAVLVVEGKIKSGTIHTANHAASQGRSVFAVPGPINSPMSEASFYLIKNGAGMATCAKDLLEELDLQFQVDKKVVEKVLPSDDLEASILAVIENEAFHPDEIARIANLDAREVSAKLTMMELKGIVKSLEGKYKASG